VTLQKARSPLARLALLSGPMPPITPVRYYRPELDLLRLFAFSLVFLSHVAPGDEAFYAQLRIPPALADVLISVAAGGAFGVDLFFALSSFLITTLLLREGRVRGSIDVSKFYLRRILRIWPLYFVFLFIFTPVLHFVLPNDSMPIKYIAAFALLSGNWACVAWGFPHSVASPLWSVSIEEQFYLAWPLVIRRWLHHLVPVALVLLAVSFIARFYLVYQGAVHPQIWCNTLARLDPIACGALIAVYVQRKEQQTLAALPTWSRVLLLVIGITILTASARYGDFVGPRALIVYPAVTAACIALLIAALNLKIATDTKTTRALIYLGRISYGLYIFHSMFVMLFGVVSAHDPGDRSVRIVSALLATIAIASISYHLLESPFLRIKDSLRR